MAAARPLRPLRRTAVSGERVSAVFDARALAGRAGLVTGAASGIGRATAEALVAAGADVVVADLDEKGGLETVELSQGTGSATFLRTDVSDPAGVESLVDEVVGRFGKLDFAHNNAGVMEINTPLLEISDDSWNRMISVDLTGVFYCIRSEIKAMLKSGGGSIVNTASDLGLVGITGQAHYVAAKHGVVGLTKAAALDYSSQGIRVNAVCPGVIETPSLIAAADANPGLRSWFEAMHPIGRLGESSEIADAVVWLVSDASTFVTGQPIAVDGANNAQ